MPMKEMTAFSWKPTGKASAPDRCFNPVGLNGKEEIETGYLATLSDH